MPRNIPSPKVKQLIKILEKAGCRFYRKGKGDHQLYMRFVEDKKRIVPIDMGANELSPAYVIRILHQFGFTDTEIKNMFTR